MKKHNFDFDLIVIGSGAGGSAAASIAARNGLKVALVEKDIFGGESPNFGDIPRRAISNISKTILEAKRGTKFGISSNSLGYNFPSMMRWKDIVINRTGAHDNTNFYQDLGIKTFRGAAHFIAPNEISINRKHISASHFLIATGSEISIPSITNLQNIRYLTPKTIFNLSRPPKSIFIIGGSPEAVEIAQTLAILGTKVYISEISSRLLPKEDEEIGIATENIMVEKMKIFVLPQTRVVAIEKNGLAKKVIFQRGGTEKFVRVDEVLIADSRTANTDIGLENAGVEYSEEGIVVNHFLQTSAKHIFATGAVLEGRFDTTASLIQSRVAIQNIIRPRSKIPMDYMAIPFTISTWPEIARVGMTEDDCIKRDLSYKTSIAPLNLIARSNIDNFQDGFAKIIYDNKGKILGASLMCPEASSIIEEIAIAIKFDLTTHDLASTPHAFLSWSEIIRVVTGKIK